VPECHCNESNHALLLKAAPDASVYSIACSDHQCTSLDGLELLLLALEKTFLLLTGYCASFSQSQAMKLVLRAALCCNSVISSVAKMNMKDMFRRQRDPL
jgi:hypothetical protein